MREKASVLRRRADGGGSHLSGAVPLLSLLPLWPVPGEPLTAAAVTEVMALPASALRQGTNLVI